MKETTTTVSIKINLEDKRALQEYAFAHDLSLSQVIRKAIKEFLNKQ